jgi:hypothetical protein
MHITSNTPLKSTGAPVINFAALATRQSGRMSPVRRLCSQYEATFAAFQEAHDKFAKADGAFFKARPKAPAAIRATKRNLADLDYSIPGPRRPITASEIRNSIKTLRNKSIETEQSGDLRIIKISESGCLPLTKKEAARLARLEAKLRVAIAYEAKCDAMHQQFKVDELDDAAQIPSSKLGPLAGKIADLPSRDRADLLAKAKIIELDPDMVDATERMGLSLAQDFIRLAGAGTI